MLNDPVTAKYTHTLSVTTGGEYTCTVANTAFTASKRITVQGLLQAVEPHSIFIIISPGTSPPSNVTAVQDDPTSVTVTWTASSDATGYRISYISSGGDSDSADISSGDSHTLTGLVREATYSISIMATSQTLPSSQAITVAIMLSEVLCLQ